MTVNKLALSVLGSLALASTGFAGVSSGKACTKCCPTPPPADDSLGVTATIGYDSSYVFRGLTLADNWVNAAIDWSLPLTDKVKLNVGANYGSSADDSFGDFNNVSYQRLEIGAGISADLGGVELGVGYRWYHHMGDGAAILDDSSEVGLTLATKLGPVNFGVGANYDFDNDGWYFEAGVNTEIKVCDRVSIVPGASVGYAVDYNYQIAGVNIDGFTAVNLSIALPIKLTKSATLTPFIAWSLPIDALDDAGEDDQLHGGVSLSVKF